MEEEKKAIVTTRQQLGKLISTTNKGPIEASEIEAYEQPLR